MATRPKRPRDPSQLAKLIVDISTGQTKNKAIKPKSKRRLVSRRTKPR